MPRGVEHRTCADQEALILCFEPAGTINTGNLQDRRTRPRKEWRSELAHAQRTLSHLVDHLPRHAAVDTKLAPVTKPDALAVEQPDRQFRRLLGLPTRPAGCCRGPCGATRRCRWSTIQPGLTQLTRTSGARLIASAWVSATSPPLLCRIGFGVRLRHQRPRRGDRYDRAVRPPQRLLGGAGEQEGSGQIGVDDAMPFRERQAAQSACAP